MSTDLTYVIPTDARWTPGPEQESRAIELVRDFLRDHQELTVERPGRVELYHGYQLFESIHCPSCGAELDIQPWWTDQLDAAWDSDAGFVALELTTPCCGAATSLNDLANNTPQGFASWAITVRDPLADLADWQVAQVEEPLGHRIRVGYAHL